jgi:hypothetical protein
LLGTVAPLGGVGNLFATAAVGNDAQRKKGQDRSDVHAHFLLTFGDASRPPVGAVIYTRVLTAVHTITWAA